MKTIYSLISRSMNGSVTMGTHIDNFIDKDLAEETRNALEVANADSFFPILYEIKETEVFEDRKEVGILNQKTINFTE